MTRAELYKRVKPMAMQFADQLTDILEARLNRYLADMDEAFAIACSSFASAIEDNAAMLAPAAFVGSVDELQGHLEEVELEQASTPFAHPNVTQAPASVSVAEAYAPLPPVQAPAPAPALTSRSIASTITAPKEALTAIAPTPRATRYPEYEIAESKRRIAERISRRAQERAASRPAPKRGHHEAGAVPDPATTVGLPTPIASFDL